MGGCRREPPLEDAIFQKDNSCCILGVDEVGRGALAGPIFAACCGVAATDVRHPEVWDSKRLTPQKRAKLFYWIRKNHTVSLAAFSHCQIDTHGVGNCNREVLRRAVLKHPWATKTLDHLHATFVDGILKLKLPVIFKEMSLVKGDSKSYTVGCASIIAKCLRDYLMVRQGRRFPVYGFEQHKGYGTAKHIQALKDQGLCEQLHRRSFCRTVLTKQPPLL